jgi:DNA gyrase subunit B
MSQFEPQNDEQQAEQSGGAADPAERHDPISGGPVPAGGGDDYGADKIKVLEGLEAVRKRPAMYIGSTGAPGLHHLVYEIVDNSIDEALAGHCDQINVTLHIDHSVTVVDNGRGIPVDQHASGRSAAEVVLTVLHAGGKFDNESYKVSGGLHGVGVSVVNALSEMLDLEIWRNGQVYHQTYERGTPVGDLEMTGTTRKRGTKITFKPDSQIFEETEYSFDTLAQRLRELAFLNGGVTITIDDERDGKSHKFLYEGGINSFVQFLNQNKNAVNDKPIYMRGEREGIDVEIALQWNDGYAETVYSFANNINTHEGGTHLSGFRAALTRTINYYVGKQQPGEGSQGRQHRRRRHPRGPDAVISVKIPAPAVRGSDQDEAGQHRGQGDRRGNRQRPARRVSRGEPHGRQEGSSPRRWTRRGPAKRRARRATSCAARGRSTTARCPASWPTARSGPRAERAVHRRGESAGGSAKQGRDRRFQAILPMKGKILNVEKARFDKMLGSDEIKTMIAALGCGIGARTSTSTSCATTASSS